MNRMQRSHRSAAPDPIRANLMRSAENLLLVIFLFLSACNTQANNVSAIEIPSPTSFQPGFANASDSPDSAAAPTSIYVPILTPPAPTPPEIVILPQSLAGGLNIPQFVLPTSLNPLTGLPPSDPSLLERRPLAIKVANYPRYIRPQSGLTLADNVFEYYIEGGLTGFTAVMYGNDSEWVGPVGSGHYHYFDQNIQRMYQAYLVFRLVDPRVGCPSTSFSTMTTSIRSEAPARSRRGARRTTRSGT